MLVSRNYVTQFNFIFQLNFYFDTGRVIEKGKHSELLARKGLYSELYAMQALAIEGGAVKQNENASPQDEPTEI